MKKILSIIVALTFVTAASAQTLQKDPAGKLGQKSMKTAEKSPMLAGGDGVTYWSYYGGNSSSWTGLGTGSAATFHVAVKLPNVLAGSTLKSINIPVISTSMTSVTAWVRTNLDGANAVEVSVPDNSFVVGNYTNAPLTADYVIPAGDVYVGYTFTSTVAYPIAVADGADANSLYLKINEGGWGDYSGGDYGLSPLQIAVTNLNLPDYAVTFEDMESLTLTPNTAFKAQVLVDNSGKNAIESIDYTIEIDGQKSQKHLTLEKPIPAGINQKDIIEVEGVSVADIKKYTVKVTLDKVNGQANSKSTSVSAQFMNVTRVAARRTVVEEFTGTGCGWCTRGWVGMEYLKEKYQDKFVGIAFHKYNSDDPMYVANYVSTKSLGISGAPSCSIDRKITVDPFYGTDYGIWYDLEDFNAVLPIVDVSAKGVWNEDQTAVDVMAKVEALTSGIGFTVAYVLTADQLSGTTSEWKQTNYYYQYSSSTLPTEPNLAQFGSGGKNGKSSVFLTFNDVMIGSSYNSSGVNQAKTIEGSNNAVLNTVYEGTHTVKMPTKETLKNAIQNDKVFANVLIISNETGEILNAARVKVMTQEESNGISDLNADNRAEVARYSLDGRRLNAPQKGVNIVKFNDGKTQKVVVK
ncbi:MAG: hypothetical protein IKS94_04345 [Prevotella sp.]|nr:hypothetical protein [Prevotella sp.]